MREYIAVAMNELKERINALMLDTSLLCEIESTAKVMVQSIYSGGKIVFVGNGGSAAEAQHLAAEFMGKFQKDREPLAALALTVNTSVLTAIANDYSYDDVFQRQVKGLVRPQDVVVGLSTSGMSSNVVEALNAAKEIGAYTVAMTGRKANNMIFFDKVIDVPADDTPRIQELHLLVGHILCGLVESELFGGVEDEGDIS